MTCLKNINLCQTIFVSRISEKGGREFGLELPACGASRGRGAKWDSDLWIANGLRRPNSPSGSPSLWAKQGDNRVRWRSRSAQVGRSRDKISSYLESNKEWWRLAEVRGCCQGFTERIWGLVKLIKEVTIATLSYDTSNFSVVCEVLVFWSESIFVCSL